MAVISISHMPLDRASVEGHPLVSCFFTIPDGIVIPSWDLAVVLTRHLLHRIAPQQLKAVYTERDKPTTAKHLNYVRHSMGNPFTVGNLMHRATSSADITLIIMGSIVF